MKEVTVGLKSAIIIIGLAIIIAGISIFSNLNKHYNFSIVKIADKDDFQKNQTSTPDNISSSDLSPIAEGQNIEKQKISPFGIINSTQSKLSYSEALNYYQNNMLQFDENCQLVSKARSFTLGNEVMIDNRASKPKMITIGTASIILGPYDYGFMTLEQRGTNLAVDCEDRKNTANLIVQ